MDASPPSPESSSRARASPTAEPAAISRSRIEVALLWLEGLLALGAYVGAIGLLTGGLDIGEAAANLPFGSLTLAGVALGLINGVLPTVVLIGALRRHLWAAAGHLVVGLALVAWIVTQVILLGPPVHLLQAIYFAWGWIIAALAARLLTSSR